MAHSARRFLDLFTQGGKTYAGNFGQPGIPAMSDTIFLAGAAGAIGTVLVPLLRDAGYTVHGTTRSPERAKALQAMGAKPVIVDVFDAAALAQALEDVAPCAVIHQLTDLPQGLDPKLMADAAARNARIRDEGTRNLVAAATAAGATRIIAQSIAWAYAEGPTPHTEDHPLDTGAEGMRRVSVGGVAALETHVLGHSALAGTVLRYGQLYGPGTGADQAKGASPLHVEAAAYAALLALQRSAVGIYNIAEENAVVSTQKATHTLGWNADMRVPAKNAA
jgi:nucleoside-diphosphate-sugar epimerase